MIRAIVFVVLLSVTTVTSYRFDPPAPTFSFPFDHQRQVFLIDINSAETYIVKPKPNERTDDRYDPSKSKYYRNLTIQFQSKYDSLVSYDTTSFSGFYAEEYSELFADKITFGLVENINGEIGTVFDGNIDVHGRIGVNDWIKKKTNLRDNLEYKPYSLLAKCFEDPKTTEMRCDYSWSLGLCLDERLAKVDPHNFSIPVKSNPKHYWQVEGKYYSFDKYNYNRKFNLIFSTTSLDIKVPEILFNLVSRSLEAKKTKDGFEYDCSKRNLAKDIKLNLNGQKVVIPGTVYADQVFEKCFLRLSPNKGTTWVLGTQFYYAYLACFDSDKKIVTLNKSLYGEFEE